MVIASPGPRVERYRNIDEPDLDPLSPENGYSGIVSEDDAVVFIHSVSQITSLRKYRVR